LRRLGEIVILDNYNLMIPSPDTHNHLDFVLAQPTLVRLCTDIH